MFSLGFVVRAFVAGAFIAALCAILGNFLVLKKLSLIGDGLSHVSFGAIALALFFGVYPLLVAIPLVLAASYFVLKLSQRAKLYGDAAIGIVSAVGVSIGVMLASLSNGFNVDLFAYLFGNILAVSAAEVWLSIGLSAVVLLAIFLLFNDLMVVSFDEDYAKMVGVKASRLNLMLTWLTAITVVLAVKVVGVMLVSALLILPAVSALQLAKSFRAAMALAVGAGVLSVLIGITISVYADLPAGATIVLANFAIFLVSLLWRKVLR